MSWRRSAPRSSAISYYSSPTNLGVAGGRNLLLRRPEVQSSDVMVILDNDVITPPGHIERLVGALSDDPNSGVIGAAVLDFRAVAGALGIDGDAATQRSPTSVLLASVGGSASRAHGFTSEPTLTGALCTSTNCRSNVACSRGPERELSPSPR